MKKEKKGVKIRELIYHYLEDCTMDSRLKSIETAIYNAIPLIEFFGEMEFNRIKPLHIKNYQKKHKKAANTMKRELDMLRASINVCLESDTIENYDENYD